MDAPQNMNPVNPMNQMNTTPHESSWGPIIGIIVIIAIVVLGGIYFWGKNQEQSAPQDTMMETSQTSDASLEAELSTSGIEDVDAELSAIDQELAQ